MIIDIISIFPNLIESYANESILKRAQDANLATINAVNLRDYSSDKFRHIDDTPYGGGAGMVFKCEPCFLAIEDCLSKNKSHKKTRVIYTSPCGKPFNQEYAEELSFEDHIIILCGRYEGVDQRIIDTYVTDEISIGDYVITGGELASLVISDAVLRLIPDVLGNNASCEDESFTNGLLEYPHYTKPEKFHGLNVPCELLSGNHAKINLWRRQQMLKRTLKRRPDILDDILLSDEDKLYLEKLKSEDMEESTNE